MKTQPLLSVLHSSPFSISSLMCLFLLFTMEISFLWPFVSDSLSSNMHCVSANIPKHSALLERQKLMTEEISMPPHDRRLAVKGCCTSLVTIRELYALNERTSCRCSYSKTNYGIGKIALTRVSSEHGTEKRGK